MLGFGKAIDQLVIASGVHGYVLWRKDNNSNYDDDHNFNHDNNDNNSNNNVVFM